MEEVYGATFSSPDLVGLTAAIIDAAPYTKVMPTEMRYMLSRIPTTSDWRARMLAPEVDGLSVRWGDVTNFRQKFGRIGRNVGAIAASFPAIPVDPKQVLAFVETLPFELAISPPIHMWMDDYFAPAIGATHALLGWCALLKGEGHERLLPSRRWIEHGPWRLFQGLHDITFIQFHELDIAHEDSMPQAEAAHDWMVNGFLRLDHRFTHDINGIYTEEDGLLRILINDRTLDDVELLDACAARRNGREDPDRPIRNIAYVFMDEDAAVAHLDALWLRGLECRTLRNGAEVRLDEEHSVALKEGWW